MKNGSGPGSTFPGKFEENNININPTMLTDTQNLVESDPSRDGACKQMDRLTEMSNKGVSPSMPLHQNMAGPGQNDGMLVHPVQRPVSDAEANLCPSTSDTMTQQEELMVEGGTISISSVYSEGWVG